MLNKMSDSGAECASGIPDVIITASSGTVRKRGRPRTRFEPKPPRRLLGAGIPIGEQARELICRVREFFKREYENGGPLLPLKDVVKRTADAVGVNKCTVVSIGLEKKSIETASGLLDTPDEEISVSCFDPFDQDASQGKINKEYYLFIHVSVRK